MKNIIVLNVIFLAGAIYPAASSERSINLFDAAKKGDLSSVISLVGSGHNVTIRDGNGSMPIHFAAENGHADLVSYFLHDAQMDPNLPTGEGLTPLHYAVRSGSFPTIKLLAGHKAIEIDAKTSDGLTPFIMACFKGDIAIAEFLLAKGADKTKKFQGCLPLVIACEKGHEQMAVFLKEEGLSIDELIQDEHNAHYVCNGFTYLQAACRAQQPDLAERALRLGADGNAMMPLDTKTTPLIRACWDGGLELVKVLLKYVDVNKRGIKNVTPLIVAVRFGHLEIVKQLTAAGADIEAKEDNGNSAFTVACKEKHLEVLDHLVEIKKANFLQQNGYPCEVNVLYMPEGNRCVVSVIPRHNN